MVGVGQELALVPGWRRLALFANRGRPVQFGFGLGSRIVLTPVQAFDACCPAQSS